MWTCHSALPVPPHFHQYVQHCATFIITAGASVLFSLAASWQFDHYAIYFVSWTVYPICIQFSVLSTSSSSLLAVMGTPVGFLSCTICEAVCCLHNFVTGQDIAIVLGFSKYATCVRLFLQPHHLCHWNLQLWFSLLHCVLTMFRLSLFFLARLRVLGFVVHRSVICF